MIEPETKYRVIHKIHALNSVVVSVLDAAMFEGVADLPFVDRVERDGRRASILMNANYSFEACIESLLRHLEGNVQPIMNSETLALWGQSVFVSDTVPVRAVQFLLDSGVMNDPLHLLWCIDQALRELLGVDYDRVIEVYNNNMSEYNWVRGKQP